jgi:uncharacterized membrane protein
MADDAGGRRIFVGIVAAAGGLATVGWSLWHLTPQGGSNLDKWQTLGMLVVALGLAFGVAAMLRYALSPLTAQADAALPAPTDPGDGMRTKIAPLILSIGSVAIVALAGVLIVAFVVLAERHTEMLTKVDSLLNGVFTAVLPVVATWVGTVLAFYFGSENFRQAAQHTREALSDRLVAKKKISDPGMMVPFDRIGRLDADGVTDAESKDMEDVIHMMSEAARRVIVFNKAEQCPIYVIRSSVPPMPAGWIKGDFTVGDEVKGKKKTIKDYLDTDGKNGQKNRVDATNFKYIAEETTPEDALSFMARERIDDLFITKDGKPGRVLGWTTSTDLGAKVSELSRT